MLAFFQGQGNCQIITLIGEFMRQTAEKTSLGHARINVDSKQEKDTHKNVKKFEKVDICRRGTFSEDQKPPVLLGILKLKLPYGFPVEEKKN